jgi:hypothetical protein
VSRFPGDREQYRQRIDRIDAPIAVDVEIRSAPARFLAPDLPQGLKETYDVLGVD